MAHRSPGARKTRGTQSPVIDFDGASLTGLADGDPADFDAGRFDGMAYADVALDAWNLDSTVTVDGCRFTGLNARTWALPGARIVETAIASADVPVVSAARSGWRDVDMRDSRFGSIEAYDAAWRGIRLTRCKLGYVNLQGAEMLDVAFVDCTIDELDLMNASARRLAFPSTRIGALNVTGATLADVDLRDAELREVVGMTGLAGATISVDQLQLMAPALAELAGLIVED